MSVEVVQINVPQLLETANLCRNAAQALVLLSDTDGDAMAVGAKQLMIRVAELEAAARALKDIQSGNLKRCA